MCSCCQTPAVVPQAQGHAAANANQAIPVPGHAIIMVAPPPPVLIPVPLHHNVVVTDAGAPGPIFEVHRSVAERAADNALPNQVATGQQATAAELFSSGFGPCIPMVAFDTVAHTATLFHNETFGGHQLEHWLATFNAPMRVYFVARTRGTPIARQMRRLVDLSRMLDGFAAANTYPNVTFVWVRINQGVETLSVVANGNAGTLLVYTN